MSVVFGDASVYAWGGEPLTITAAQGDETVGELTSVGWSPLASACVGLGYVRGDLANRPHAGTPAQVQLWGVPTPVKLHDQWPVR